MSMYNMYKCIMCKDLIEEAEMVSYKNDNIESTHNFCRNCVKELQKEENEM